MNKSLWIAGAAPAAAPLPPRLIAVSQRSTVSELLQLLGAALHADAASDARALLSRQLRAGASLFQEGDPVEAVYFVTAGSFKVYRTAEDGYEQVLGFAGRGEVLGFDGLCMRLCPNAALALEDAGVLALSPTDVLDLQRQFPAFAQAMQRTLSLQLQRRGDIVELMAAVAAEVRLARFLVQLSERMQACGQSPRKLRLRMCRRDLASYLGLAHETVSRSFSTLVEGGYLQVSNRDIDLQDLERLKALARNTRGTADHPARRPRGLSAPHMRRAATPVVAPTSSLLGCAGA